MNQWTRTFHVTHSSLLLIFTSVKFDFQDVKLALIILQIRLTVLLNELLILLILFIDKSTFTSNHQQCHNWCWEFNENSQETAKINFQYSICLNFGVVWWKVCFNSRAWPVYLRFLQWTSTIWRFSFGYENWYFLSTSHLHNIAVRWFSS